MVDNATSRILENGDVHMVKDDSITETEGADKLREIYRYIPEAPKSEKERKIIERNDVRQERNIREERKLIADYDLFDNPGSQRGE